MLSQLEPCPARPAPVAFGDDLPPALADALRQVDDIVQEHVSQYNVAGAHMLVTYGGRELLSQGYGLAHLDDPDSRPTDETIFQIASVTKVFTAVQMYQLKDQGLLDIHQPVKDFQPLFDVHDPFGGSGPTFHQLASHTSGLPRETPCPLGFTFPCNVSTEEVLQFMLDTDHYQLKYPAYSQATYSNLGISVLGHVMSENVVQPAMEWGDYMDKHVLQPLGMNRTGVRYTDDVLEEIAQGYELIDGEHVPQDVFELGWDEVGGGLYSTTADLSRFLTDIMSDSPTLLSVESQRQLFVPVHLNADHTGGFGTGFELQYLAEQMLYMKSGAVPGYNSIVVMVPELKLGVVMLSNGQMPASVGYQAFNILLPALRRELLSLAPVSQLPSNAHEYEGKYVTWNDVLSVEQRDGRLWLQTDVYLQWREGDFYVMRVVPESIDCWSQAFLAMDGTVLEFTRSALGRVTGFDAYGAMMFAERTTESGNERTTTRTARWR